MQGAGNRENLPPTEMKVTASALPLEQRTEEGGQQAPRPREPQDGGLDGTLAAPRVPVCGDGPGEAMGGRGVMRVGLHGGTGGS